MSDRPSEVTSRTEINPWQPFWQGLSESAVKSPWNAIAELSNATVRTHLPTFTIEQPTHSTFAREAGQAVGFALTFALATRLARIPINGALTRFDVAHTSLLAESIRLGCTGAAYGGLCMPNRFDDHIVRGRLKNAAIMGLTCAAWAGASELFVHKYDRDRLLDLIYLNFWSGATAGAANSVLNSCINKQTFDPIDTLSQAARYGAASVLYSPLARAAGSRSRYPAWDD